jgi:hypothetical protein
MFVNRTDAVSRIAATNSNMNFIIVCMVLTCSYILGGIAVVCRDLAGI